MRPGSALRRHLVAPYLERLGQGARTMVDVGGNDGAVTAGLVDGRTSHVVIDLDRAGLLKVRSHGAMPVEASLLHPPLKPGSIDVLCCLDVLPCVPDVNPAQVYNAFHEAMVSDGHLIVTEVDEHFSLPFVDNAESFARWRAVRAVPTATLRSALRSAGFEIEVDRRFYGLLARLVYSVFFIKELPARGHRIKHRVWSVVARIDNRFPVRPQASLLVARPSRRIG